VYGVASKRRLPCGLHVGPPRARAPDLWKNLSYLDDVRSESHVKRLYTNKYERITAYDPRFSTTILRLRSQLRSSARFDVHVVASPDPRSRQATCIALYGNVRCPGQGHDIVKSHDIVGAPTISCRHDIVSPPTILLREYDIVLRSRYRVCVCDIVRGARYRPPRAISWVRVVISYASPRYRGWGVVSCRPALS
jgi:hypothetical protein